jgi:hypothetical protein
LSSRGGHPFRAHLGFADEILLLVGQQALQLAPDGESLPEGYDRTSRKTTFGQFWQAGNVPSPPSAVCHRFGKTCRR